MTRSLGLWSWADVWVVAIRTLERVTFFAPEVPRPQDLLGSILKPPLYKLSLYLFSEICRHLSCRGQQSQGCLARKHSAPFRTILECLLGTASLVRLPLSPNCLLPLVSFSGYLFLPGTTSFSQEVAFGYDQWHRAMFSQEGTESHFPALVVWAGLPAHLLFLSRKVALFPPFTRLL